MGGLNPSNSRKLSKPRKDISLDLNSYHEQPDSVSSPLTPSTDTDYFGDHATVVNSQGERRSRRKSRTKLRAYLHGSSNESSQALDSDDDEEEHQFGLTSAARGARKRISRTGSSIMLLSSAMASTTYLSNDSSPRLHSCSDAEDCAITAEQIIEKAYHDSLAAMNHVSSPVDEDKHVDSVLAPLRRKSLYTPGIATRHPHDILRKPPPPRSIQSQSDRDYYYNPAYPESSPLARLAALGHPEDGRSTPSDLHITHLGGLQLGTLRVTNGTESPISTEPSEESRKVIPESHTQYFLHKSEKSHDRSASIQSELTLPRDSTTTRLELVNKLSAPFSTLQHERSGSEAMAHEYISEISGSPFTHSNNISLKEAVHSDLPLSFDDSNLDVSPSPKAEVDAWRSFISDAESRHALGTTQDDAFRKLNANTPSVLDSPRPSVPLSSSSGCSNLVDQAPRTDSGYSSNSSLGNDFKTTRYEEPEQSPNRFVHGPTHNDLSEHMRCVSGPREMPLEKSRTALAPFKMTSPSSAYTSVITATRPAPVISEVVDQMESTSLPILETQLRISSQVPSQSLPRRLQKRPKSQPAPVNLITVQGYRELTQAHIPRVPSLIAVRHAERSSSFPVLEHTFPSSEHVTTYQSSLTDDGNIEPIRFPSPRCVLEPSASAESSDASPTKKNRKGSLSRPRSIFRRGTAAIDDTDWGSSELVQSPSWSGFGGGKKKEQKKLEKANKETERRLAKEEQDLAKKVEQNKARQEKQIRKEDDKRKASRSRASSKTRGRSSERRSGQYDVLAAVADFGTVTESLGGSPYDVATSMSSHPSAAHAANNVHPHQMSTLRPRPKSTIGMDDTAASNYGRARSRTRSQTFARTTTPADSALSTGEGLPLRKVRPQTMFFDAPPMPAISAVDFKSHDVEWMRNRQRSRSLAGHRNSGNPAPIDEIKRASRPQDVIVDAPPVPALLSPVQVQKLEAQIAASRPRSMIIESPHVPGLPQTQHNEDVEGQDLNASVTRPRSSTPRKTKASNKAVPGLWSNGSLEKKAPKTSIGPKANASNTTTAVANVSSSDDSMWEAQGLLLKNQLTEILASPPAQDAPSQGQLTRPRLSQRAFRAHPDSSSMTRAPMTSAAPLTSYPNAGLYEFDDDEEASQGPQYIRKQGAKVPFLGERRAITQYQIPRKRVGSGNTNRPGSGASTPFERLVGRYEGGLLYGYEKGYGLGGSAGPRGAKTEAHRKSMDVSRGFGIDLSDTPVFVAATPG